MTTLVSDQGQTEAQVQKLRQRGTVVTSLAALSLVVLTLNTGCTSDADADADETETTTTVGFIHPFTGALAAAGTKHEYAAELALRDINDHGGLLGGTLALDKHYDQTDADTASAVAQELIDEGVELIVGSVASHATAAILDVAVPAERLTISGVSSAISLSQRENDGLFFRTSSTVRPGSALLAERIHADGVTLADLLLGLEEERAAIYQERWTRKGETTRA